MEIRLIPAHETHALRQRVLRPHQTLAEMEFEGDHAPDARHYGAFLNGALVGVGSVRQALPPEQYQQPGDDLRSAWQIRGMAVSEEMRGRGVGMGILHALIGWAAQQGGTLIWCNARTPALSLYRRAGFATRGDEFYPPHIGPHYFMARVLTNEDSALLDS
ncbi:GNAT family N-acetyltransferase [Anaerolineae bacterium CFX9]|nr:GNAT family N-acetyltransferase [Anaerolineae bacterium CFX9]